MPQFAVYVFARLLHAALARVHDLHCKLAMGKTQAPSLRHAIALLKHGKSAKMPLTSAMSHKTRGAVACISSTSLDVGRPFWAEHAQAEDSHPVSSAPFELSSASGTTQLLPAAPAAAAPTAAPWLEQLLAQLPQSSSAAATLLHQPSSEQLDRLMQIWPAKAQPAANERLLVKCHVDTFAIISRLESSLGFSWQMQINALGVTVG